METANGRNKEWWKQEYIKRIMQGHPTYKPDSALACMACTALQTLNNDVLMYLSLMVVAK